MSKKTTGWNSPGVRLKPTPCKMCAFAAVGKGFCQDYVPEEPKIAFIMDIPTGDDIIEQYPFSGAQGFVWTKILIEDLGYKKEDVLITHAIRCKPENDKYGKPKYPSSFPQKQAELNCRQYDEALVKFDPNVFVITLHPRSIHTVGCHQVQIQRDVSKALSFANKGYRPAVLFGDGPAQLYFPYIKDNGGLKSWRGHWWIGSNPFKDPEQNKKKISKRSFVEG